MNPKQGWDLENQKAGRWARPEEYSVMHRAGWATYPLVLGENRTQPTGEESRGSKPQDNVGS